MIQITKENFKAFKEFLAQDGIQYETSPSPDGSWFQLKEFATDQIFKINKDVFEILFQTSKYDPIIFGKDETERVVSIEIQENKVEIFQEMENGSIQSTFKDYKPWLLTPIKMSGSTTLEGRQWYKYYNEYNNVVEFQKAKSILRKKEVDYYTANDLKENYMLRKGLTYFKAMKPNEISVLSFDIETSGITRDSNSEVYLITNTYRNPKGQITRKTFNLFNYEFNQQNMIADWCKWVRNINPSIMLGHNIYTYDFPFLQHCYRADLPLGRDGSGMNIYNYPSEFRKDGSQTYQYNKIRIYGRELIDTMFLAIKYDSGRKYTSYGLKSIIKQEGLEKPGRVFIDAAQIKKYFNDTKNGNTEMWNKTVEYAENDSDDSLKLFDLMIPAVFYSNQSVPKSFQNMIETATGSQINSLLVRSYLQNNESIPLPTPTEHVEGGISFAIPGVYRNLIKVDLKSCYPSQILRFKLYDQKKDPKGLFYYVVKYFTEKRFEYKKLGKETKGPYYKDLDASAKIFINSAYGVCQTAGLNFNAPHIAARITEESRKLIDMALIWGSGKGVDYWKKLFNEKVGKEDQNENE